MLFGQNLVTNGDFERGATGFTSDYIPEKKDPQLQEGYYAVASSARDAHNLWVDFFDHTGNTSSGRYLVANGGPDVTVAIWRSGVITVASAKTPYRFEAWISKVYPATGKESPVLSFEIGNGSEWVELGKTPSIEATKEGTWIFTYADAQFSASGKYLIRLKNANPSSAGNDLGLDDICFGRRRGSPSIKIDPGEQDPPIYSPTPISGGPKPWPQPTRVYGFRRVHLRRPETWNLIVPRNSQAQDRAALRAPTAR